jgi:hypothetical protein
MKNSVNRPIAAFLVLAAFGFFMPLVSLSAQDTIKVSSTLPDSISLIVTRSCMPCHSNDGGMMSRTKLNFSEWADYTPEHRAERANKMYSELSEGKMPPKKARERHPELIPDDKQIGTIKRWAETLAIPEQ